MENVKAPGKMFLFVTSIIGLVFSSVILLTMLNTIILYIQYGSTVVASLGYLWEFEHIIVLLLLAYGMFMYIMGIVNCANLNKAERLQILGIIFVMINIVDVLIIADGIEAAGIILFSIRLVLPILYIVGTSLNRQEYIRQMKEKTVEK
ncbi:MAG: hypothetical protein FWC68_02670 [Oscillospiraceae bacterium]|nr:hypothetical protein [Oscillospiraceae bacterium]